MAVHDTPVALNSLDLGSERTLRTSCNFLPEEYPLSLALVASGQVNVEPWITHRFPLREVKRAFETALKKEKNGAFKIMIQK